MSDAFRDDHRVCPSCGSEVALSPRGLTLECQRCQGVFVPTAHIAEMVPPPFPDHAAMSKNRRCPLCPTAMYETSLWSVPVERCDAHGTWFDWKELALVLELAGGGHGPETKWQRFWRAFFVPRRQGARAPKRPDDL